MANISEEFVNGTQHFFAPPVYEICLKESPTGYISWNACAALCFLIGTSAHLWCLWVYFCTEQKIKETQLFWLNHTVMEIIYCLECGTEVLNTFIFNNDILWCLLCFFFGLSWTGRALLQICICIEQYLAVLHPVTFLSYKAIKYRIAPAVISWLLASGYGVYIAHTLNLPDFIFTSVFIIALAVVLYCCVSVLYALKQPGPGDTHTAKDGGNQQKRNAFKIIFSALLLILFTYLPQALLIFFTDTGVDSILLNCTIVPFTISVNVFGVVITPLLKLYKENQIKCLNYQKEIKVTT